MVAWLQHWFTKYLFHMQALFLVRSKVETNSMWKKNGSLHSESEMKLKYLQIVVVVE